MSHFFFFTSAPHDSCFNLIIWTYSWEQLFPVNYSDMTKNHKHTGEEHLPFPDNQSQKLVCNVYRITRARAHTHTRSKTKKFVVAPPVVGRVGVIPV